ncbi:MAG: carboxylesterase [Candidatus Binatota bacterium]|nr:carboxylesterase [Candidatus Binatota bacterium]
MRFVARALTRAGWRVEAPLLPGHGATQRELLATRWRDWLAGARRGLEVLTRDCDHVLVAGLSMGALLAVMLAAEDCRVCGIALLSTTLRYDGRSIPAARIFLPLAHAFPFLGRFFYWNEAPPYGLRDVRLQRVILRAVNAAKRGQNTQYGLFRTSVSSVRQLDLLARRTRRQARNVACPALVVHSLEDTVTTTANATEIFTLLGTDDKRMVLLGGCDHVITLDLRRDAVARHVVEFGEHAVQSASEAAAPPPQDRGGPA